MKSRIRQKSRLNRTLEKRTKKHLYWSLLGIVVILFLLIKFGIPLLINFSLFLAQGKDQQLAKKAAQNQQIILPPTLIQSFTATNSATITVNGNAVAKQKIELFVNNNLTDIVDTKDDGSFSFQNVSLNSGINTIASKAKADNKESGASNILTISFSNKAPSLSVDSPSDGQTFSGGSQQDVIVKGKTDADVKVTVNGFWAIVDANGNYSYSLHLQNGGNPIKVIAQDAAGNQTEKDLSVNFNQ